MDSEDDEKNLRASTEGNSGGKLLLSIFEMDESLVSGK